MGMEFRMLGSSSSGNAGLLRTDTTQILIDAGFACRRLDQMLKDAGTTLKEIDAIFLTHEHGDHAKAISGLHRHPHIRVFANRPTAAAVQSKLKHRQTWQVFENGRPFAFRDLDITPFTVPHDAADPVGFRFEHGHTDNDLFTPRRALGWATDLGHAPALVREHLRGCHVLILEANHCTRLLDNDPRRPWSLKQRIKSRHGHLSNEAAFALLAETNDPAWEHVYLAHLSRDCNSVETVRDHFAPLQTNGHAKPFALHVVDPVNGATAPLALT